MCWLVMLGVSSIHRLPKTWTHVWFTFILSSLHPSTLHLVPVITIQMFVKHSRNEWVNERTNLWMCLLVFNLAGMPLSLCFSSNYHLPPESLSLTHHIMSLRYTLNSQQIMPLMEFNPVDKTVWALWDLLFWKLRNYSFLCSKDAVILLDDFLKLVKV